MTWSPKNRLSDEEDEEANEDERPSSSQSVVSVNGKSPMPSAVTFFRS